MDNNNKEEKIIANSSTMDPEELDKVTGGTSVHHPSQHIYDMDEGLSYDGKDRRAGYDAAMNRR